MLCLLTLRLLSSKSRAYCCCLHFWLPIACVVLDNCPIDQHMHLDLCNRSVNPNRILDVGPKLNIVMCMTAWVFTKKAMWATPNAFLVFQRHGRVLRIYKADSSRVKEGFLGTVDQQDPSPQTGNSCAHVNRRINNLLISNWIWLILISQWKH